MWLEEEEDFREDFEEAEEEEGIETELHDETEDEDGNEEDEDDGMLELLLKYSQRHSKSSIFSISLLEIWIPFLVMGPLDFVTIWSLLLFVRKIPGTLTSWDFETAKLQNMMKNVTR